MDLGIQNDIYKTTITISCHYKIPSVAYVRDS